MNRVNRIVSLVSALGAVLFALASPAAAQVSNRGFALNRYEPSERGSDWFVTESLDLRGDGRFALGLVGDWSRKPLTLRDASGNEIAAIVSDQVYLHLGGAVTFIDRVRVGLSLPLVVLNSGEPGVFMGSTFAIKEGAAVGDLRLGADVRLLGEYGDLFTAAFGLRLHLPTGSRDAFTGDGQVRIVPRFSVAGEISAFAYGAHIGTDIRTQTESFAGEPSGSELVFGASAGLWLIDHTLLLGPELQGTTVLSDAGDGAFGRRTTPLELILGGHYRVTDEWRVGAGVGPGFSAGFGAPAVRVLASVEWVDAIDAQQEPVPLDRDQDGYFDDEDACPDEKGVANVDPNKNGCPPPADRDGDEVIDTEDACPDEKGVRSDEPDKNGCPPPPPAPTDRDGDGIFDGDDACPEVPGEANADRDQNGCPQAIIEESEVTVLQRVEFETNRATLRPESDGVLQSVLAILKEHAEILLMSIEGHTDDRGEALNLKLSQQRADAVKTWLVAHGIEAKRLETKGFGETRPLDPSNTDEARRVNRRVEFLIVKKADPAAAP